ncbi:TetR/AcrR family transcriptional regulator [Methanolobus sp.]|uniref:TetR/AcrR family transcriptional regulator n=1 Tax=Methanolobus sp. TaxID=1874737 RepID=UPI0025D83FE7|nr:TetR/AcrR family transcriptional regulator [Methanolobus sp.]
MSLREKKKQDTRNRIFEVSGKLFKDKGFENTTVDEITKEAGIAKGTFFNYFPTKESLLCYFKEHKEAFIFSIMENQMSLNAPVKEKIKNFLVLVAEYYEKDKELLKLLFFEHKRLIMSSDQQSTEKKQRHQRQERFINMLSVFLREGVDKGEIKKGIDLKIASESLNAIYFHSLIIWLHSDTDSSFSRDMSAKIDIIFEGIGV